MFNASQIREHAEIISADGQHIGTVDHVEGNRIKLTKSDSPPGHEGHDHHHYVDLDAVASVESNRVRLTLRRDEILRSLNEQESTMQ